MLTPREDEIAELLSALSPSGDFLNLLCDVLSASLGLHEARVVDGTHDESRDIVALDADGQSVVIQAKHTKTSRDSVADTDVRLLKEAMDRHEYARAFVVTNGRLSATAARRIAEYRKAGTDIDSFDGQALFRLIQEQPLIAERWLGNQALTLAARRVMFDIVPLRMPECAPVLQPVAPLGVDEIADRLAGATGVRDGEHSWIEFSYGTCTVGLSIASFRPGAYQHLVVPPVLNVPGTFALLEQLSCLRVSVTGVRSTEELAQVEEGLVEAIANCLPQYEDRSSAPCVRRLPLDAHSEPSHGAWLSVFRTRYRVSTLINDLTEVSTAEFGDETSYIAIAGEVADEAAYALLPGGDFGIPHWFTRSAAGGVQFYSPSQDVLAQVSVSQTATPAAVATMKLTAEWGDEGARRELAREVPRERATYLSEWLRDMLLLRPIDLHNRIVHVTQVRRWYRGTDIAWEDTAAELCYDVMRNPPHGVVALTAGGNWDFSLQLDARMGQRAVALLEFGWMPPSTDGATAIVGSATTCQIACARRLEELAEGLLGDSATVEYYSEDYSIDYSITRSVRPPWGAE